MSRNYTFDHYARWLRLYGKWSPNEVAGMPGIDLFHGAGGYSAIPRVLRMIEAMTAMERAYPGLLGPGRREQIALASGVADWEIDQFFLEFGQWRNARAQARVSLRLSGMGWWQRLKFVLGFGSRR